jgi:hypothetical protein
MMNTPRFYPFLKSWLRLPDKVILRCYKRAYFWEYFDENWDGTIRPLQPYPTREQILERAKYLKQKYFQAKAG